MSEVYKVIGEWFAYSGGIAIFMGLVSKCINIKVKAITRGELVV